MDPSTSHEKSSDGCSTAASEISSKSSNGESEHFKRPSSCQNFEERQKFSKSFFRGRGRGRFVSNQRTVDESKQNRKKEAESAIYGNFSFYYGYRNQSSPDARLTCLKKEWLADKDVLDIGCNTGHFTLTVARDFSPRMIIGIDIDGQLIRTARKNTKHYMSDIEYDSEFPISFVSQYGPLALGILPGFQDVKFPYNVTFMQCNYVLKSEKLLKLEEPKFDTIFCLSTTKWIHLNWGDEGLKLTFCRIHAQLKNGGHFILEYQPYKSYHKNKKMTETHKRNFKDMKLLPDQFNDYLLNIVGFKTCELIDTPAHSSQGFSRPLYLFTKGDDYRYCEPKHIIFKDDELVNSCDDSDVSELSD